MNISNYEKKRRQHEKELNSFRNKMGKHIVWFDSLSKTKQYDLLFGWKREKNSNKLQAPEEKTILRPVYVGYRRKMVKQKITSYPASLKHFIIYISLIFYTEISTHHQQRLNLLIFILLSHPRLR